MKTTVKIPALLSCLFLLSSSLLYTKELKAQYIIAGKHGANDYYAAPDTSISTSINTTGWANYFIDINGDNTNDFEIFSWFDFSPNILQETCWISPLNSNQVIDTLTLLNNSCNDIMAFDIVINDTISNTTFKWNTKQTQQTMLAYYLFQWMPNNWSCGGDFSKTDTAYIGVRVLKYPDTLYGWIRVSAAPTGCLIIDYACNITSTDTQEYQNNLSIKVYPNPSNGFVIFQMQGIIQNANVNIYNVLGEKVYSSLLPQPSKGALNEVDLSKQPSGVYFYRIEANDGNLIGEGKLIIQRQK